MADGATFDPTLALFVFNGVTFRGRAGGEFFNRTNTRDFFSMTNGVDNAGYYTLARDSSATMTITLLFSAIENDILQASLDLDLATPGGLLSSIMVKRGRTLFAGLGRVAGQPATPWSDGAQNRVWTVISTRFAGVVGGQDATPVAGA